MVVGYRLKIYQQTSHLHLVPNFINYRLYCDCSQTILPDIYYTTYKLLEIFLWSCYRQKHVFFFRGVELKFDGWSPHQKPKYCICTSSAGSISIGFNRLYRNFYFQCHDNWPISNINSIEYQAIKKMKNWKPCIENNITFLQSFAW